MQEQLPSEPLQEDQTSAEYHISHPEELKLPGGTVGFVSIKPSAEGRKSEVPLLVAGGWGSRP